MALVGNSIIIIDNRPSHAKLLEADILDADVYGAMDAVLPGFCQIHQVTRPGDLPAAVGRCAGRNVLLLVDLQLDDAPSSEWTDLDGTQLITHTVELLRAQATGLEVRGLLYSTNAWLISNIQDPPKALPHGYASLRREIVKIWKVKDGVITQSWMNRQTAIWAMGWALGQYYLPAHDMQQMIQSLQALAGNEFLDKILNSALSNENSYLALRRPDPGPNANARIQFYVSYLTQYSSFFRLWEGASPPTEANTFEYFKPGDLNKTPPLAIWLQNTLPLFNAVGMKELAERLLKSLG